MKKSFSVIFFILILTILVAGVVDATDSNNYNSTSIKSGNTQTNQITTSNSEKLNSTLKSSSSGIYQERYWWDQKQHGIHSCGPTSGAMALSALGILVQHEHMTIHYKTTLTNTIPSAIISGSRVHAAEKGIKLTGWFENFNNRWKYLGQCMADPNIAVVLHGNTSGWKKYYESSIGHYVFPVKIDLNQEKIWIADPDRPGILEYTFAEFKPGLDAISQPSMIVLKRKTGTNTIPPSVYEKLNDHIAPTVVSIYPSNRISYSQSRAIIFKFSENITPSWNYNNILVKNLKTNEYITVYKKVIIKNNLYIYTSKRIQYNFYSVIIKFSSIKDYAGNNLAKTFCYSFKNK
jgi:hypothetical protein